MSDRPPSVPPLRRQLLWGLLVALLFAILLATGWSRRWLRPGTAAPPVLGEVPEFALRNRDGRPVARAELLGGPSVVGFVFTRCAGQCPRILRQMIRLEALLPHPELVRRVTVSVDPAYDTPEVLAAYAAAHSIADPRWLFLTGEPAAVERLVREGFKLALGEGLTMEEPILHATRLVLVDGRGRIRGYYDALDEEAVGELLGAVRAVLRES